MQRVICGQGLVLVKGGKVTTDVANTQAAREARQVREAKELVRDVGRTYRPLMRAAVEGRLPGKPKGGSDL